MIYSECVEVGLGLFILSIISYKIVGNSWKDFFWSVLGDSWIYVLGSLVSYDENLIKEICSGSVIFI